MSEYNENTPPRVRRIVRRTESDPISSEYVSPNGNESPMGVHVEKTSDGEGAVSGEFLHVESPRGEFESTPEQGFFEQSPEQESSKKTRYSPTDDESFLSPYQAEIASEMSKRVDNLMAFVEEKINNMQNKLLFNGNMEPSMWEIDSALMMYEPTLFALIAAYESAKVDEEVAEETFKEWYAVKYMEVRNKYNTIDVKNSAWLSAKEIDATVYSMYKTEAAMLKSDIIIKQRERSTLERLLRGWENYQYLLGQLSKNAIVQIQGNLSGVDLKRGDEME